MPRARSRRRVAWKWPQPFDLLPKDKQGRRWNRDGTPSFIPLYRWEGDKALHGTLENACCTCETVHVYDFAVAWVAANQRFYLVKRAYKVSEGRFRRARARKGRR